MGAPESLPPVAILVGGFGTRLRSLTATAPKSMIEVAGKPFVAHQLELLVAQGFTNVVLCSGHFAEQIESFVGDGASFGCQVRYSRDGELPKGTGGALKGALRLLGERFLVMYGDSYLTAPLGPVYDAFLAANRPALMTVFRNAGRWDASNVEFVDGQIRHYDKTNRTPAMLYIDYGLGVFEAGTILRYADKNRDVFDLADLYCNLARRGLLAGHEVHSRFFEIGSPTGLAEANNFLMCRRTAIAPVKSPADC